jgi:hypothetical protein
VKRALLIVALLFVAALLVVDLAPLARRETLPVPQRWNGRAAMTARAQGPVRAGAAKVKLPVKPGSSLAGYASLFGRHWDGSGEELFARALVIESNGLRQILVALELLLISPDLEAEIFRRAALPETACALIAATHTHSGPGGTWDAAVAAALGSGRFDREQRDAIAQAATDAIAQATAALQPASLRAGQLEMTSGPAVVRSAGQIDPMLSAVRAEANGKPIATLAVYGMHPTVYGRRSRRLSAEWPGAAARGIERTAGGVALVLQGAVGNTTWPRAGDSEEAAIERLGARVAASANSAAALAAPADSLSCSVRLIPLPPPEASRAVPWVLRRAATNVLGMADPRVVPQVELGIGELLLLGVPGEPVGSLGMRARHSRFGVPLGVIGLADGYVGYVETVDQLDAGSGEAARSYFGNDLAQALGL